MASLGDRAGVTAPSARRVVRAPGRINLIGEHIDYHDLDVLPMALDRGITIEFAVDADGTGSPLASDEARAVSAAQAEADARAGADARAEGEVRAEGEARAEGEPRAGGEPRVRLTSTLPGARVVDIPLRADVEPGPAGDWGNYVRAAVRVAVGEFGARRGIEGVVRSALPPAAGLSSSSALVVAVAMALLDASEVRVDALELAAALAKGERFVGTAGGGMDQAASLLGVEGHALQIGFAPLRVTPIAWPSGWRVVVAHSGVHAEKSGAARDAYNARRTAGTAAALLLAERLGLALDDPRVEADESLWPALLQRFGPKVLLEQIEQITQAAAPAPDPGQASSTRPGLGPNVPIGWLRHTVLEAERVPRAVEALNEQRLQNFAALLNASHASLRDDFEVSHPTVDALVDCALTAGALGARITGAGFGGCMIALCADDSTAARVATALEVHAPLVFTVDRPGDGASITRV